MGRSLLQANYVLDAHSGQAGPVLLDGNRVIAVGQEAEKAGADRVIDLEGTLLPGLIDLQVNGAGGRGVEECTADALDTVAQTVWSGGAVAFLPIGLTPGMERVLAPLEFTWRGPSWKSQEPIRSSASGTLNPRTSSP